MANSAGSAEKELAIYQESAEYLYNQFKETFTSIAQNAVNRDDLKNLIKFGTSMLELVDRIVGKIGLIPTILSTIVGITASKAFTNGGLFGLERNFNTGKLGMTFLGGQVGSGWLDDIKRSKENAAAILANKGALQSLLDQKQNGVYIEEEYSRVINNSNAAVRNLANGIVRGKVSQEELNAAMLSAESAGKRAGIGATAAAIGVKVLNTAVSMLITMGISLAINALVKAFSDIVNHTKNLTNELKDLNRDFKTIKSEISELNGKLADTREKIAEIEKLPKISVLQEEELEELKKYNEELERQKKLKEAEKAANRAEAREKALDLSKNSKNATNVLKFNLWDLLGIWLPGVNFWVDGITDVVDYWNHDKLSQQLADMQKYKDTLAQINELKKDDAYKKGDKEADKKMKALQDDLDESVKHVNEAYQDWVEMYEALRNSPVQAERETAEEYKKLIDEWDTLIGNVPQSLKELFDEFPAVKQYLMDLANKGELAADKFQELNEIDCDGIDDFRKALENIEGLNVDKILESVAIEAERVGDKADNSAGSVYNLAAAFERLNKTIDGVITKEGKLAAAFNKISLGESLSPEEVLDLIRDMEDLAKYVRPTADGFTLTDEGMKAGLDNIKKQANDDIKRNLEKTREQIALIKERDKYKAQLEEVKTTSNGSSASLSRLEQAVERYEEARDAAKGVTSTLEELEEAEQNAIVTQQALDKIFDGLNPLNIYDDAKGKISDFNNDIKTLDSTLQRLNETSKLNYDEATALVEIAPQLQDLLERYEHNRPEVIAAIEEQRKKSLQARNEYIDGLIKQTRAEIEAAKNSLRTAQVILNIQNKWGSAEEQLVAQIDVESAEKKLKDLEDLIEKYEAFKGDIEPPEENDDLSDLLQNEIDYYNNIISAVEIMRDKYSEAIDKEIDALEEGKDALKDANDERQRELDLIEARNNLENAKKRKVWVYSDDGGFRQVQDEGAVKEAEEKYRDAVTEIQVAEIDKEIELREKQKEALEENTKALTELEQNIQNALTVEQAKADLGLSDEKELLNLPADVQESIKNGLADAMTQKNNKDNEGTKHKAVTLDDVLKSFGAKVSASELGEGFFDNIRQSAYDSAVKGFADSLNAYRESAVSNVVTNNSGETVISPTINIYDATDPQKVGKVVVDKITDLFNKVGNSAK